MANRSTMAFSTIKALLRRSSTGGSVESGSNAGAMDKNAAGPSDGSRSPGIREYILQDHLISIDTDQHRMFHDNNEIYLTAAEWNILTHLAAHEGQVFSRIQLLEACLESMAEGSERTVDTHIKNLRQKLEVQNWIETVRGFGYRFSGRSVTTG